MHRRLIFFIVLYQANACLDLLVRSFNEVFSPMIETGDGRIRKPHNVDDLTKFYQIDESGNIIPNINRISRPYSMHVDHVKSIADDEELLLSSRNGARATTSVTGSSNLDDEETDNTANSETSADQSSNTMSYPLSASEIGVMRKYKKRGQNYVPGKRPLADLLIKMIEMLQVGDGQLHYDTK